MKEATRDPNLPDSRKIKEISTRMEAVKLVMKLVKKCNLKGVYPLRPLQEKLSELIRLQRCAGEHQRQQLTDYNNGRGPKQTHNRDEKEDASAGHTTTTSSKPPYSSSASTSCAPSRKKPHRGGVKSSNRPPPPPHSLPPVRPIQPACPYQCFGGGFYPPPPPLPLPPPHPNQFGAQIRPGDWSNFPSSPYPGFM